MAMDFPSNPILGETYQAPGGPLYTWDGEAWITGPSGPVPMASRRPTFGFATAFVDDADGNHPLVHFQLRLPFLPRVSDGTLVTFVALQASTEGASLDVNFSGHFPLLTNQGDVVGADDIRAHVPCTVVLYHRAWYLIGGSNHA